MNSGEEMKFRKMSLIIVMCVVVFGTPIWASPGPEPEPENWFSSLFGGETIEATGENLVKAILEGDLEIVKDLVERGADVNHGAGEPLGVAARDNQIEIVRYLLSVGANPNGSNEKGIFLGHVISQAGKGNHLEIIDMLLEAGATVKTGKYGVGVMDRAAENGHLEAVKKFLEAGADPNHDDAYALLLAASHGHVEIVKALIEAGADVNANAGWVIGSAAEEGQLDAVRVLIEAGVNQTNLDSSIKRASSSGKVDVVKLLLEKGADPDKYNSIKAASENGHVEAVRVLLEAGSTITKDENSGSPLHYAAMSGSADVIALLVEYGADINTPLMQDIWWDPFTPYDQNYGKGWTVMHIAARFGFLIVKELVDLGAHINLQDNKGRTAIQIAVTYENTEVTKAMLKFCSDVSISDKEGKTALDLARVVSLKNASSGASELQNLTNLIKKVMPERTSTDPNNSHSKRKLRHDFVSLLDANATLKQQLGEPEPVTLDYENAITLIFEERARKEMQSIIEDNYCRVFEDQGRLSLGMEYVAKCSCIPGEGPRLVITPLLESEQCVTQHPQESVSGP